ncbi:inorganic phosphate transporter [Thermococcus barossii]|uniref:Sodium:phosphate symporter n=1 Tax=Thermococcus barossii TaxID=54077 RepID=A0A2Z2MG94_9EURY|nr:inorganic phosphate transporter [Thermococcus barossii]ASJ04529.1 sodium:phosphate symporter [Thermococcus barossii]
MIVLVLPAVFMAWAIGANDSAKAVGTAVGSGVLGFKRAVLLIGIFTTLGVLIGGSGVSGTISGLAEGMSAGEVGLVLFSAASAVTLASLWGRPISTTQSIIGGLVGASLALGLPVDWWTVGRIASAWVLSPLVAALFAVMVYRLYKPLLRRIKCLRNLELTQKWLVFTAAAFSAFNLGANELSNVAGLMEGLGINGPFKLVLAITLALGALTFSYEVMMTVGRDISPLGPTSAFSSQFGASLAVSAANLIGLPVSSGQAIVGAISGLGIYKGERVNLKLIAGIVKGWVVAPVFAGAFSYVLVALLA